MHALRATGLLDTPADPSFDRLTRLASRVLGVPTALVTLVDEDRQFFKSCLGLPDPWMSLRGTPLTHSFCQHVVATAEPLIIEDAREHPLVWENLAVAELNVVAYAGIPLVTDDGHVLGSFCVIDRTPRRWTPEEIAILTDLAASVMTEIGIRAELAERRRLEQQLVQAQAAERLGHVRGEFLERMSHELRTPLNSVIGFANVLIQKAAPTMAAAHVTFLERIRENGRTLLGLIDDMLSASEASRVDVQREPVALDALLDDVVRKHAERAAARAVVLRAEVPPTLHRVLADRRCLGSALTALVDNAIKFTREGTVTVRVIADGMVAQRIEVTDTGIGIPPERIGAIFEPFEQGTSTTRFDYGGTGLGLATARDLCAVMGFRLSVRSTPGVGSTFSVELLQPSG